MLTGRLASLVEHELAERYPSPELLRKDACRLTKEGQNTEAKMTKKQAP